MQAEHLCRSTHVFSLVCIELRYTCLSVLGELGVVGDVVVVVVVDYRRARNLPENFGPLYQGFVEATWPVKF